tara:strand:+ start:509 stop:796 length:288 start_codon:yes stop_codon:yes gene_type:complete
MKISKTKLGYILSILLIAILFTSCADANLAVCVTTDPYGFWGGTWHGSITTFSFIGSLFSDNIAIYAVNNSGAWYDFGFLFGATIVWYFISSLFK